MRKNPLEYYRILGLPPGSGAAELKRAYRQLIQRWHPDHFKSRSLMQTTAEDLTKEINEAYEQLYKKQLYKRFLTKTAPRSAAPFTPARPTRPAAGEPAPPRAKRRPVDPAPPAPPRRKTRWRPRRGTWIRVGVGLTLIAALFAARSCEPEFIADLRAVIHAVANAPAPARPEPGPAPATRRAVPRPPSRPAPLPLPGTGNPPAVPPAPRPPRPAAAAEPAARPSSSAPAPEPVRPTAWTPPAREGPGAFAPPPALLSTFECGDSKARVLAVQGPPDDTGESILRYGSSVVYLQGGRVTGWSDGIPRLRIRHRPRVAFDLLDTFVVGSSRAEVARIQGPPTSVVFGADLYGSSVVYFEHDRVARWIEGYQSLRTGLIPPRSLLDREGTPAAPGRDENLGLRWK